MRTKRAAVDATRRPTGLRPGFEVTGFALCCLCLAPAHGALGQDHPEQPALVLELSAPAALHVDDRASVTLSVRPSGDQPMLITPRAEGAAIQVARGRLHRRDGQDRDGTLVVPIPILALNAGHATLTVHVQTFTCDAECRPVEAETRLALRIERAR